MASSKNGVSDLAIFGGASMFERTLHVGGPNVGGTGLNSTTYPPKEIQLPTGVKAGVV